MPTTGATAAAEPPEALVADVFNRACLSRELLGDVTGRWGALALVALEEGTARFNALRRRVDGVSEKMLSQTLQGLERDGMVARDVVSAIPPRVEYSLTPLGRRVAAQLRGLVELLEAAVPEAEAARRAHASRAPGIPAPGRAP